MAKNLLIVESPAKTKTLARFLGPDFDIMATIGHIIDLPKSKIGVDPKNNFEPQYTVIEGKEKVIKGILKAAKKADNIYLAPDPDREGEAIAWHVANTLSKGIKGKIYRVTFNEITKTAVLEAIANPREINTNLVNAQQARRVLDRLVGYTVSPFLWKTIAFNLSAGRVQSVALRLVCEREIAINAFNAQEYWNLTADMQTAKKGKLTARLFKIDGKTVVKAGEETKTKVTIGSEKEINGYIAEIKKETLNVETVKNTTRKRKPLPPFITSTLQQEAAKAFSMAPKRTMSIAQKLYEGAEMGKEGAVGLITYMRTDSFRVAGEALSSAREFIKREYSAKYLPNTPIQYGKKKSSQDAHEAIRPTSVDRTPEKMKKHLSPQQLKIYTLIWNRFVASQMNPAEYDVHTVDINAGRFQFRITAQSLKFDGFLKVYHEEKEPDESTNGDFADSKLPKLSEGDKLKLVELTPTQSFTKPPARFSEAMLIKELEANGIGRPSTYAAIVSTIRERKYVELTERKLYPTELGIVVNKTLTENFPDLFNVTFTAGMEQNLDSIEDGKHDWIKILGDFYGPFIATMDALKGKEKDIKAALTEKTGEKCEKCGHEMVIKWGRNGRFQSCSDYPKCKNAKPMPGEEETMTTDKVCEKCGKAMVVKTGRYGKFLACSGYPDCKTTQPISLGIKCPKDKCTGEIVEKKTKTRRTFYGCSKYPDCDFASWDTPVNKSCPSCKNYYLVAKSSKVKGDYFRCPACKANITEEQMESEKATT